MDDVPVLIERSQRLDNITASFQKLLDGLESINRTSWRRNNKAGEYSVIEGCIVPMGMGCKAGGIRLLDTMSVGSIRRVVLLLNMLCDAQPATAVCRSCFSCLC